MCIRGLGAAGRECHPDRGMSPRCRLLGVRSSHGLPGIAADVGLDAYRLIHDPEAELRAHRRDSNVHRQQRVGLHGVRRPLPSCDASKSPVQPPSKVCEWVRELHFPDPRLGPPAGGAVTTAEKSPD
jgi:hypothetical protein